MNQVRNIILSADIPPIPGVLQEIMSMADHPRTTSSKLESLVVREPALASQILKWVNSPLYYLPKRVSSVSHAMILLGFSTVKSIVSGMVLIDTFENTPGLSGDYVLKVWKHTLVCANLVKILADRESQDMQDDLFLAGMIHDVGHLILAQYFGDKYQELTSRNPFPAPDVEKVLFEVDHAETGAALLQEWKFPERVIELVKGHHQYQEEKAFPKEHFYLVAAEKLADKPDLVSLLKSGEPDEEIVEVLSCLKWTWKSLVRKKNEIELSLKTIDELMKH